MEAKDLLIADLEHFGESMWRNEEVGEKRFSFFVTLVTAVAAGLVALRASKEVSDGFMLKAAAIASTALFIVGLLSYLRMIHRNRTTDEYQQTLKYIRAMYVAACPELKSYEVPRKIEPWGGKWLRGGYAETIATVEGMLLSALLVVLFSMALPLAVGLGVGLTVVMWVFASPRKKG